jgi:methyl-accepting chemotaxis protein
MKTLEECERALAEIEIYRKIIADLVKDKTELLQEINQRYLEEDAEGIEEVTTKYSEVIGLKHSLNKKVRSMLQEVAEATKQVKKEKRGLHKKYC